MVVFVVANAEPVSHAGPHPCARIESGAARPRSRSGYSVRLSGMNDDRDSLIRQSGSDSAGRAASALVISISDEGMTTASFLERDLIKR